MRCQHAIWTVEEKIPLKETLGICSDGKNMGLESDRPELGLSIFGIYLESIHLFTCCLVSLSLSFLFCKIRVTFFFWVLVNIK